MPRAPLPILALLGALCCSAMAWPAMAGTEAETTPPAPAAAAAPATTAERTLAGHARFDLQRPDIVAFVAHMSTVGFTPEETNAVLATAEPQPKIIDAMNRPA